MTNRILEIILYVMVGIYLGVKSGFVLGAVVFYLLLRISFESFIQGKFVSLMAELAICFREHVKDDLKDLKETRRKEKT